MRLYERTPEYRDGEHHIPAGQWTPVPNADCAPPQWWSEGERAWLEELAYALRCKGAETRIEE